MKLVTGANGLVGSYLLVDLLKRGHEVKALKRTNSNLKWTEFLLSDHFGPDYEQVRNRLTWADWKIEDIFSIIEHLNGVDEVYHCAAMVSFHRSDRNKMLSINVNGTENVVNALISEGADIPLCHISSTAALGRVAKSATTEDMDFEPNRDNSFYGFTKFLAETEVERGRQEGLRAAIVNPSVIVGFTDPTRGSGQIIGQVLRGIPFASSGSNGVVYAEDVSKAAIGLMENQLFEGKYICVGGHQSFAQQKRALQLAFGKRPAVIRVPDGVIRTVGGVSAILDKVGVSIQLTPEIARSAISNNRFDTSRISQDLNIEFTSLERAYQEIAGCYERFFENEKSR